MTHSRAAWPSRGELARLVRESQGGRPRALDALLSELRPPLVAFFARRLPCDAAEDFAQLALLRIARALPRIDADRAEHYVRAVARNLLRTAYSRSRRDAERSVPLDAAALDAADALADPTDLNANLEAEELSRAVRRVSAAALAPELRDIVLALLRGERLAEFARRVRTKPATIRTRLMRARAVLRGRLRAYLGGGQGALAYA